MRPIAYMKSNDSNFVLATSQIANANGLGCLVVNSIDSLVQSYDARTRGIVILHTVGGCSTEIANVRHSLPGAPILLAIQNWNFRDLVNAIRNGADEVVEWPCHEADLELSIRHIIQSAKWTEESFSGALPRDIANLLSPQEARILSLIVSKHTTKQISKMLDLSIRTVHYRKNTIFAKMNVRTQGEAIERVTLAASGTYCLLPGSDKTNTDKQMSPPEPNFHPSHNALAAG